MTNAQQQVFDAMNAIEPIWNGLVTVSEVIKTEEKLLLHAGPPFKTHENIPKAVLNSICIGAIFEGWAANEEEALEMLKASVIKIAPAQDFDIVVPLAGIVSPSMSLIVIADANNPKHAKYSVLNEGMSLCTRLGIMDLRIVEHLKWLNGEFSDWLRQRFSRPIALAPILQKALLNGDDCHGRTIFGSSLIAQTIFDLNPHNIPEKCRLFLNESLAFSLNFWMAMSSLIMSVAEKFSDSLFLTKVGGNGYEFGVQISKNPGYWLTDKAPTIHGKKEERFTQSEALGSIGDSPLVDFLGLGGQVLDLAIQSSRNLKDYLPADYAERPQSILLNRLRILGDRFGISDIHKILNQNKGPLVLLGMIDQAGIAGRIGGGVLDTPVATIQKLVGDYI